MERVRSCLSVHPRFEDRASRTRSFAVRWGLNRLERMTVAEFYKDSGKLSDGAFLAPLAERNVESNFAERSHVALSYRDLSGFAEEQRAAVSQRSRSRGVLHGVLPQTSKAWRSLPRRRTTVRAGRQAS